MKEKSPTYQTEHTPEKSEPIFEIKHHLGGFDVRLGISKEGKPFEGSIDFTEGKIEAHLTPDGVKRSIEAVDNFLSRPEVSATIRGWTEKIKAARRCLREKRVGGKENAHQIIKEYARQESKTEAEVLDELLKEIAQQEGNK